MTRDKELGGCIKNDISKFASTFGSFVILLGAMLTAILFSDELGAYVTKGLELALTRVIPTALPFMIISDIVMAYARIDRIPILGGSFSIIFGMPPTGVMPYVIGNICGFPLGGKLSTELYRQGILEKEEAEKLLALASNPSPSFIIGSVGVGLLGDRRAGILLLVSVYIASVLVAQFFRGKCRKMNFSIDVAGQSYSLIRSIKSAGEASVVISSFIIIFACLVGLIENHITVEPIKTILISVIEVTSAVNYFAGLASISEPIKITLIAFSLGFGGISAFAQTASFAEDGGLSMRYYVLIKIIEGFIASVIAFFLFSFFI